MARVSFPGWQHHMHGHTLMPGKECVLAPQGQDDRSFAFSTFSDPALLCFFHWSILICILCLQNTVIVSIPALSDL